MALTNRTPNSEESSTYSQSESVYSALPPTSKPTSTEDIQRLADLKFESTGKGLTYKDLLKPKYRYANTVKQAQRILRYYKNTGKLYTNSTKTVPQQYFCSKQDVQLARRNNDIEKFCIHSQPLGVVDSNDSTVDNNIDNDSTVVDSTPFEIGDNEEIAKADALTRAILNAANGAVPIGIHDIHIHVNLPTQYVDEVYNNRLADVPPQQTRQRAKRIEARIDGYLVTCLFYPKKQ